MVRPTPLLNNPLGTDHVGLTAYDAKWSNYGEYMQLFVNSVQAQWERILEQSAIYPQPGTEVIVVFRMNAKGAISQIVKVQSEGSHEAQAACVSAITDRAPYGAWTEDMKAMLGQEQELTFHFTYY